MRTRAVPGVHDASERALADLSDNFQRVRAVIPPRHYARAERVRRNFLWTSDRAASSVVVARDIARESSAAGERRASEVPRAASR